MTDGRRLRPHVRIVQIMTAITEDGPLPFSELVERLPGVNSTDRVQRIVGIAEDRNVLRASTRDGDMPEGLTKGRPGATQYVEIHEDAGYVIGLNIGRTYFALGVGDPNGQLLSTVDEPSRELKGRARDEAWDEYRAGQIVVHDRKDGVDGRALLRLAAKKTVEWLETLEVPASKVRGITLSLPAPVSTTESKVLTTSIEPQLGNVESIEDEFRAALGKSRYPKLEKVIVGNDADVAARGEVRYGKAYKQKDVVVVHASYGIGAGVISDGKVLRTGSGGGAGEIGHCVVPIMRDEGKKHGLIPLEPDNEVFTCVCDCSGHLEAMAGGQAIINRLAASLDNVDPAPPNELAGLLADPNRVLATTLEALLSAISERKPWQPGLEAVLDSAHAIGGIVHTLTHIFKPEAIYVAGKLSEAGEPFLDVVREGWSKPGSLENYRPVIELGNASSEFGRRLIMVRGAAMTAVRGTKPLITAEALRELESDK